jgi:hypothetical protein
VTAGLVIGTLALLDRVVGGKIGFRGALPEPFDIGNHAMSVAVPVGLAGSIAYAIDTKFLSTTRKFAFDGELKDGFAARSRKTIKKVSVAAFLTGALYVIGGEVASSWLNKKTEEEPVASQQRSEFDKMTAIGDFDWLDVLYGVSVTGAFAASWQRRSIKFACNSETINNYVQSNRALAEQESKAATGKGRSTKATTPKPQHNKRYTPPKNQRNGSS